MFTLLWKYLENLEILIYPELTLLVLNFKLDTSVIKKKKI